MCDMNPPWHEGERFLQEKAGVVERMAEVGSRVIRDYMPQQHRDFYAKLPLSCWAASMPGGRVGDLHRGSARLPVVSLANHA